MVYQLSLLRLSRLNYSHTILGWNPSEFGAPSLNLAEICITKAQQRKEKYEIV